MTLAAGTPIGKYVVRRKLAEGGMAEIYLARSRGPEGFEKEVVIKRVRAFLASDESFVQMFIAEARLVSRLNHANLVQIFDFDKHEDSFYLAMEYVRGQSLWDARKRSKEMMQPMPPVLVAQVGVEVAKGLHHAHNATDKGKRLNLVHRDVTPHNVLLSYEGAVKLTDFGVAKAGTRQTAAGVLKGKFAYMSPEQARGEDVDARTDVFALGIVLWEMLTGARLFNGDSDVAVLRSVQQSAIAPPARLNPSVHPELDRVVMKALERDPASRFQTAQELERGLAGFVLQNAKSVDDTDVGAYLRRLFPDEHAAVDRDATSSQKVTPEAISESKPATARMRVGDVPPALSPDEDVNGSTYVVARGETREPTAAMPLNGAASAERPVPVPKAIEPMPHAVPDGSGLESSASAVRRSKLTIGMRRGLLAGGATFVVVVGLMVSVILRRQPAVLAPVAASATPSEKAPAPPVPIPVEPPKVEPIKTLETEAKPAPVSPAPEVTAPPEEKGSSGRAQSPGQLVVNATPWATVFIDSQRKGEIYGSHKFPLRPGRHTVRLVHGTVERTQSIEIEPGKSVTFDLAPKSKP